MTEPTAVRVLVAEDCALTAQLIRSLLERRGCAVALADDGQQALELAIGSELDVLILDLELPGLNGLQVIRRLRAREQAVGGHLPVAALTSHRRDVDRQRCEEAGMDAFLSKPVRAAELWALVEQLTQRALPA